MSDATTLAALEAALEAIWLRPPADLEGIRREHRPPSVDMPRRLYANFDVYWLAGILYALRGRLAEGALPVASFALLLEQLAAMGASRLARWGLADAAALLERVAADAPRHAGDAEALDRLTSATILYLNRLLAWVDATIPWAALDRVAPLDPPAVPTGGDRARA